MSSPNLEWERSRSSGTLETKVHHDQPTTPNVSAVERRLAHHVLRAIGSPPIGLVLCSGEKIAVSGDSLVASVVFRDRATFWRVLLDPNLQFGDAYSDGRLDVEGDLVALIEAVDRARTAAGRSGTLIPAALLRWLHHARANTFSGARENIHRHYDLGEDFYKLWLDDEMVYSGAYFATPDVTLEDAQRAKLNYVCRKLRLRPGETVVEVGGGWGALALLMARDYGVRVQSFNISRPQIQYARRRAQAQGLDSRVEFLEDDYRNIRGRFDALVSLGMLEHVGIRHYREFGRMMNRCLGPTGRGLIQSIGQDRSGQTNPWIERRIFPGAYPPTLREMADLFEPSGFSIVDIENLRLHYAKTLRHWLDRFEASAQRVAAMFDQRFVRLWRLYLAGSCAAFQSGGLQLFQVLFSRPGINEVPWTRSRLYADA
jgi:cyclopropane-fatty-acyl-phospholipid synthase